MLEQTIPDNQNYSSKVSFEKHDSDLLVSYTEISTTI